MTNLSFKKDEYSKARGNYSRRLNIYCRKCNSLLLTYQKDGPGNLRRLYLDRIMTKNHILITKPNLSCSKCKEILGIPIIYEKEKRKAYRLFQDAVTKKVRRLN